MNSEGDSQDAFQAIFSPRSVAVVGASTHGGKVGNFVLRSALASGVERIYPVHGGERRRSLAEKPILPSRRFRTMR